LVDKYANFDRNHLIYSACHCIEFDGLSGAQSNGTFMSPNWPQPYHSNVDCLLYQFVGKYMDYYNRYPIAYLILGASDEIVQLSFYQFDLAPKDATDDR
jgi:hypothetical protein